jgi:hypothetical protein
MRKRRYRCKRYLVYLPKAIGDLVDTQADYDVRIFGPAIVIFPKGLVNFLSRFDKLENALRENTGNRAEAYTDSLLEDSRAGGRSD